MRKINFGMAALAAALAGPALAVPVTTNPGSLTANGDVKAVFAFVDAADTSKLFEVGVAGVIFNNSNDAVGSLKILASTPA